MSLSLLGRAEAALELLTGGPYDSHFYYEHAPVEKTQTQRKKIPVELFYQTLSDKITKRISRSTCNVNVFLFESKKVSATLKVANAIESSIEFFGSGQQFGVRVRNGNDLVAKQLGERVQSYLDPRKILGRPVYAYAREAHCTKEGRVEIRCFPQIIQWMNEWKNGKNKKYYEMLLNGLKPYLGDNKYILGLYEGFHNDEDLSIYPTALEIPTIPVVIPTGEVYEKEFIESHRSLQLGKQKFEDHFYRIHPPLELNSGLLSSGFQNFHGKENPKFASRFTTGLIEKLRFIKEEMRDDSSFDQEVKIDQILHHYIGLNQSAGMQLVLKLSIELTNQGVIAEQRRAITEAIYSKTQRCRR